MKKKIALVLVAVMAATALFACGKKDNGSGTAKKTAKVTWKKVDGAKSYKLYRATKKSGKYTLVKKNITKTSYLNKNLKKGKTYYYKVTAVNAFDKACKTSAVKSVKIKK